MALSPRCVVAATVLGAALAVTGCSGEGRPRGVVLITIDTCRADRIGCYGATNVQTPAIDGIAERGTVFRNAQAPVPVTLPSHASILTGLYPDRHGLRDNGTGRLPEEAVTLAEVLRDAGWHTGAFLSGAPIASSYGTDQGFGRYDDHFLAGGGGGDPLQRLHTDQRTADQVVDAALPWLREAAAGEEPFLAWVHFFDPHSPYAPPAEVAATYGAGSYEGEIAFVDAQIERLLAGLGDARGSTVLVVTADHGESLGEHGEDTHAFLLYESTLHVPWVMAGPGVPKGLRVDESVSLVQVMPTILSVLGVEVPSGLDGESAFDGAGRGPVFAEALFPRLNFGWSGSRSIRAGRWKYIESPHPELLDLERDAVESRNVIGAHPDVAAELRDRLHRHFARGGGLSVDAMTIDEEARERLERLGYLGAGGGAAEGGDLWDMSGDDPKEMVGVFDDMQPLPTLIMSHRDDEARALVRDLTRRAPGTVAILRRVAQLWSRARNWEEARDACRRVVELDPKDAEMWRSLGTALLRTGDTEAAIAAHRSAVEYAPGDALAHAALGVLLAGEGRCAEAKPALDRAEEIGVGAAAAETDVARAWEDCRESERAEAAYDRALAAAPDYAPAHSGKALLLSHEGRAAAAVAALRAALTLLPDDVGVLNNLAWILADSSLDPAEGLMYAKRAADLAPDDPSVLDTLGWAAIRAGRPAEGLPALQRAWEATRDPEVRAHLGVALAETGRAEEGRIHVRAAIAERPSLADLKEVAVWR